MAQRTAQSDQYALSRAIKTLLREAVATDVTYNEICDSMPGDAGWNRNALKQFANRDSVVRQSARVQALAEGLVSLYDSEARLDAIKSSFSIELQRIRDFVNDEEAFEQKVDARFDKLVYEGVKIPVPSKFAFARYGRDKKKIITVLVNVRREASRSVFSMKISGNSKRVVFGNILLTPPVSYFTGLAYPVTVPLTDDQFSQIDVFDSKEQRIFADKEVGAETIVVRNTDLSYGIAPVSFLGLDGWGDPFSGCGVIVMESEFERFEIKPQVVSSINCTRNNPPIAHLLEISNANTVKFPDGGAAELNTRLVNYPSSTH